jgi:hypothetical protein
MLLCVVMPLALCAAISFRWGEKTSVKWYPNGSFKIRTWTEPSNLLIYAMCIIALAFLIIIAAIK